VSVGHGVHSLLRFAELKVAGGQVTHCIPFVQSMIPGELKEPIIGFISKLRLSGGTKRRK